MAGAHALAALLIVAAARGDLWLDEIWSIALVNRAGSLADVLRIRHDNHHLLNSLYLWLVGGASRIYVYRLFAVLCGIAASFVVARIARRWGSSEALYAVILVGTSFPLVLYFSEARGYAPAMLMALLAYALAQSERTTRTRVALFWLVSIVGLVAHSTFSIVSAALLFLRRPRYIAMHGVPLLFIAAWFVHTRTWTFGGGPIYSLGSVARQSASLLLGVSERWGYFALPAIAAVVVYGTIALHRDGKREAPFFIAILLLSPLGVTLVARPQYLYPRYFVVAFPFFYLMLGYLVCRLGRQMKVRWVPPALVAIMVAAQSGWVMTLLDVGRGQYRAAVARMSAESGDRPAGDCGPWRALQPRRRVRLRRTLRLAMVPLPTSSGV